MVAVGERSVAAWLRWVAALKRRSHLGGAGAGGGGGLVAW